jgi:hypothetical protein
MIIIIDLYDGVPSPVGRVIRVLRPNSPC